MNVELPVINVESQASDVEFCVEYVDLMLTCARWSRGIVVDVRGIVVDVRGIVVDLRGIVVDLRGIVVDLRATRVPPACHARGIKVTIYVYMAYDT